MNKKLMLDRILKFFIKDEKKIPKDLAGKINLWKEIISTKDLSKIPSEILVAEDKFLAYEKLERPLTDADNIKTIGDELVKNIKYGDFISVWSGNEITLYVDGLVHLTSLKNLVNYNVKVDKIVLNSGMRLKNKCRLVLKDTELNTGEVLITRGFNLPCDYILHVIQVDGRNKDYDKYVKESYLNILECAKNNLIRTVLLPCIGIKKDKEKYINLMLDTIYEFLDNHPEKLEINIIINVNKVDAKIVKNKLLERIEKC